MEFLDLVKQNYGDSELIKKAYYFASEAHKNEKRKSGEPYIVHPIAVATILIEMKMDEATIAAALLHDTVEDTSVTFKQIKQEFGDEVEKLVKGVSKINRIHYDNKEIVEMDSLKRMFIAMSKDLRVILIKLADRLHNIRTVEYLSEDKRIKFCSETINLFVPLAERMGFNAMKREMEDTCFKYLNPEEYEKVKNESDRKYKKSQEKMKSITETFENALAKEGIKHEVQSRFKHVYSLYKKIKSKGTAKIYDAIAFRVIVETVEQCYQVLGIVHSLYRPVPGRIKDYIASPKANGYKSLHTTVLMKDGTPFEVQIRTFEMHELCEYGIASHWRYKSGDAKKEEYEKELNWIKDAVENEKQIKDSSSFIKVMSMDLATSEIWVLTPKFKPISLPEKSTPVDFAYAVHTDIGDTCVGAKVNGKKVPLSRTLETGDVVEIITDKDKKPSRDWLKFVVSSHARQNIRNYFKRNINPETVKKGKTMVEKTAEVTGISMGEILSPELLEECNRKYLVYSFDDMFASVGAGGINAFDIVSIARQIKKSRHENEKKEECPIYIEGSDVSGVKLARCCNPVPGDEIVAIESNSGTITVHCKSCVNLKNVDTDRTLNAEWKTGETFNPYRKYDLVLRIVGKDEDGMLSKIIDVLYDMKVKMNTITCRIVSEGKFEVVVSIKVRNLDETNQIMERIKEIDNIQFVNRSSVN